jgi:alkanesulfonate monooxygenase SsuD/methylene tetrahydromethanopterin reductase-like flavin-dependent oxidoreductase (luciferase family)
MQETDKDTRAIHPWVAEGLQKVRVGVHFMDSGADWKQYQGWVQIAEELGFDSAWVADHPTIIADCWTSLAALAMTTRSIRLGSLVSCVYYRNPILLARMAADVDRLSGGRLILGLGIGDFPFEFARLGLPFPSTRERQEALEETIQVVQGVWGTTPFTYQGKYAQVREFNLPFGPAQQPHVPILIAGGGERVTLRQVAQYADASNFGPHIHTGSASRLEDVTRKFDALRAHCETFERPVDSILRTHVTLPLVLGETSAAIAAKLAAAPAHLREMFRPGTVAVTIDEAITYYHNLVQAGLQYFILGIFPNDLETLHLFNQKVLPALTH